MECSVLKRWLKKSLSPRERSRVRVYARRRLLQDVGARHVVRHSFKVFPAKIRKIWRIGLVLAGLLCATVAQADYVVQVGIFSKPFFAGEAAKVLHRQGFKVQAQPIIDVPNRLTIRLTVGPFVSRRDAEDTLARLKALGHDGFVRKATSTAPEVRRRLVTAPTPAKTVAPAPAPEARPEAELGGVTPSPSELDEEGIELALAAAAEPLSVEELFGLGSAEAVHTPTFTGFFQSELAYAVEEPAHYSKFRHTLEVSAQGRWGRRMKWRLSGRAAYDAVFDIEQDFYSEAVEDERRFEADVRETYVDVSAGNWDFRLGRQHIIWGEMVGMFVADVVSAKDMREFVLPEFDVLRIPQWAARGEYFSGDFHGEAIWIPRPTFDDIGVPGMDFYPNPIPAPAGFDLVIAEERTPNDDLEYSGYGLRLSYVQAGWDTSLFYYSSMDAQATFFRRIVTAPTPTVVYQPDHDRIHQIGATVTKDFAATLLKAEVVYTRDRWFDVLRASDADGVVRQDYLDYVLGVDWSFPRRTRLNLQLFQRWYPDHDPDMIPDEFETGASIYFSTRVFSTWEPQFLVVANANRGDWMARPKLIWHAGSHWRWTVGADYFGGEAVSLFGRFDANDRVYTDLRFTF